MAFTPLTIIVEDREADGRFLEILIEECGEPDLKAILIANNCAPPIYVLESSGGINAMPIRVERALSNAAKELRRHRVLVVCDSDTRWPGDTGHASNKTLLKLREVCECNNVALHVLRKRCAENYIPDEVYKGMLADRGRTSIWPSIEALLRRTNVQRNHIPLKGDICPEEIAAAIKEGIYSAAEITDLELLKIRIFKKRPRPIIVVLEEFRELVKADGLIARDGTGEIDHVLSLIAKEL